MYTRHMTHVHLGMAKEQTVYELADGESSIGKDRGVHSPAPPEAVATPTTEKKQEEEEEAAGTQAP